MNKNLLKYYPLSDNDDAVHKIPEIRFSGRERRIGNSGPLVRWDVDYVNFARDSYSYDNLFPDPNSAHDIGNVVPLQGPLDPATQRIVRTGVFNPATDKLRTGQRMDISPTVSYPFQLWRLFDVLPSVTYRETDYQFNIPVGAETAGYGSTAARRYVQTDIAAKTEFSSVYGDNKVEKGTTWKHSFQPELSYSDIPWIRNPNHPFFGNYTGLPYYRQWYPMSDADVVGQNGLQFDYDDRVYQHSLHSCSQQLSGAQALVQWRAWI